MPGFRVLLPQLHEVATTVLGNPVRQLSRPEREVLGAVEPWSRRGVHGRLFTSDAGRTLIVPRSITPPSGMDEILVFAGDPNGDSDALDARPGRWISPKPLRVDALDGGGWLARRNAVTESWLNRFSFRAERREGERILEVGLRTPQIGALHALLAHWSIGIEPATIVMPTGTGKTETMIAMLVAVRPACLLVVVPNDPLRDQVGTKFESLGLLKQFGVVGAEALHPIVGLLKRRPRSQDEVDAVFSKCNVIVTTMAVAGGCTDEVQEAMAVAATHLVIDEAHHVSARTWSHFRRHFTARPTLQFTATPFRRDRKHVDGRAIYSYPLRKAQEEGLFRPINFRSVVEYSSDEADEAIARLAYDQLARDRRGVLDHLIMARGRDIERAEQLFDLYRRIDAERAVGGDESYGVVLVHSQLPVAVRTNALHQLRTRAARAVVCVDMFGEGFDLPQLKIAALHDAHKSLAITLQFTGRFTRTQAQLGDATMIANIASTDVEDSLRALYAEDADWNVVLRDLSEGATGRHGRRGEFLRRFEPPPAHVPIQNVFPKMSTVVYRTRCADWQPHLIEEVIGPDRMYGELSVNHTERAAMFVLRELAPVVWGDARELTNISWDLYLLHWDQSQQLLFIHSSNKASMHEDFAMAVAGSDVERIHGEKMFRCFHDVRRLMLMNLGLKHVISRNMQFTMYVGSDVVSALAPASSANKVKSNMFGRGYEGGARTSVGCSYKGRVWSYRVAGDIGEWVQWCQAIGAKLTDDSITTTEALKHVILPETITQRPPIVPVAILWSDSLLQRSEDVVEFQIGGDRRALVDVGIDVADPGPDGPLRFRVFTEGASAEYELVFTSSGVEYCPTGLATAEVGTGHQMQPLATFFQADPPTVLFADGSALEYNVLFRLPAEHRPPYNREGIEVWDWTGTDIEVESQGLQHRIDSIQHRVVRELLDKASGESFDLVFDDDAPGEAADVIAMRVEDQRLIVKLVHCKSAGGATAGARVNDLYVLCGQAQRSVYWRGEIERLLRHLDSREAKRTKTGSQTRFQRGDLTLLRSLRKTVHELEPDVEIVIVQPGLSKSAGSAGQLDLLSVTELYLRETYGVPLRVIASA